MTSAIRQVPSKSTFHFSLKVQLLLELHPDLDLTSIIAVKVFQAETFGKMLRRVLT